MNDKDKLETWKRKVIELEKRAEKLDSYRNILTNLLDEIKTKQNIKLNILLKDVDLEDEISSLKGWIDFSEEKISKFKNKIQVLEKELSEQEFEEIKEEVKLGELIKEKIEIEEKVKEPIKEFEKKKEIEKIEIEVEAEQPVKEEIKEKEELDKEILEQQLEGP